MFVEDGVEVVVVAAGVALELRGQPRVGVVDAARVVVALPKLKRPRVRRQEDGAAQKGTQRRRRHRRHQRLQEQHRRVRHAERLQTGRPHKSRKKQSQLFKTSAPFGRGVP